MLEKDLLNGSWAGRSPWGRTPGLFFCARDKMSALVCPGAADYAYRVHFCTRIMSSKSQTMIEYAVRTCLEKCVQTDMPMTCLTEYIDELKKSGWDDSSIGAFQQGVLLALAKSSSPGKPSDLPAPPFRHSDPGTEGDPARQ